MPSSWSHLPTFNILLPLKIVQRISSDKVGDRTLSSSCRVSHSVWQGMHKLTYNHLPFWCCLLCSFVPCRLIFNHFLECRAWSGLWECETGGHIRVLYQMKTAIYLHTCTRRHICTLYQMETASRLQEHTYDQINPYSYCAMLYQWKIPVFILSYLCSHWFT